MTRLSGIEKLAAVTLLLVLFVAVFPMENPGMLVAWAGIEPSIIFSAKFMKFTVLEVVLGMALMASWLSYNSRKRVRYKNNFGWIFVLILLCIVWGYIGTIINAKVFTFDNLGIANWKKLIYGMLVFISVTMYLDTYEKLHKALFAVVLATFILDAYGLFRYVVSGGLVVQHYIGRVVFWETSKLALNVFTIVYLLGVLFIGGQHLVRIERIIYKLALPMAYLVILLSARRTSMIMALTATILILVTLIRRRRAGVALSYVGVALLGGIVLGIFNYEAIETKFFSRFESVLGVFDDTVNVDAGSTQGHVQELETGWHVIMKDPIWGVGYAWEEYGASALQAAERGRYWVHNSLLTFWMRFGILGLITYLYIYYKILRVLWVEYKIRKELMPLVFSIWFFVEFLSGLFFPPFFGYFKFTALFFGTLAIANAEMNLARKQKTVQSNHVLTKTQPLLSYKQGIKKA